MTQKCLLVIDMLNDFLDRWDHVKRVRLIERTNELIDAFRRANLPIIWVRQEFKADLSDAFLEMKDQKISITIAGSKGAEIDSQLHRISTDKVIVKKRYSAFFQTDLEETLLDNNVQSLTLTGVNTHACIRMAAIDAYQRDIRVTIAKECVDSLDKMHASVSLQYLDGKIASVKSNKAILAGIE